MWQKRLQALEEAGGLLRLEFPNRDNAPAVAAQGSGMAFVAGGVAFEFFSPKLVVFKIQSSVFFIRSCFRYEQVRISIQGGQAVLVR